MARPREPFPLKKRPHSKYWQVAFYNAEGKRLYKSTGETDHDKAVLLVAKWRADGDIQDANTEKGGLSEESIRAQVTFEEISHDFFSGDGCPYLSLRKASNSTVADSSSNLKKIILDKWLLPYFRVVKVAGLRDGDFRNFVRFLESSGLSSSHIHNILSTLKVLLDTSFKLGRISKNISSLVPNYSRREVKTKEILSVGEVQKVLFDWLSWEKYWKKSQIKVWLMLALGYACGLRIGEIQALKFIHLRFEEEIGLDDKVTKRACLKVESTYFENEGKVKEDTKTYGDRFVPVPSYLTKVLIEMSTRVKNLEAFIFESDRTKGKPFYRSTVNQTIKAVCAKAGISKNISPHRGRSFFQSVLIGKNNIHPALIDYALGHSQGLVKDAYQEALFDQLEPIRLAMEEILFIPKLKKEFDVSAFWK